MKFNPRPSQQYAANRIINGLTPLHEGVGLFIDMGVGKTASTLMALKTMHENGLINMVLVVSKKRVVEITWPDEIDKWDDFQDMTYSTVLGTQKQRMDALNVPSFMYGINIENLVWLVDLVTKLGTWPFDVVVIDESGEFFRSHKSQRFRAMKKVAPCSKLIVELTGSPRPKAIEDLWSQLYLLDRGVRLGRNITSFRENYLNPDKSRGHITFSWKPKPGAEDEVYNKISDICVSMRAEDWVEMPERVDIPVYVEMPKEARELYRTLAKKRIIHIGKSDIVADDSAKLGNKLAQMCGGAVYDENGVPQFVHSAKIEALLELIDDLNGEPVIIAYNYRHELTRILEAIPDARQFLTADDIHDWMAGKIRVAVVNPASVGHGLNLQSGGRYIIWYSLTSNLDHFIQLNRRLERPGQEKTVMIYMLLCKRSMDEKMLKSLYSKDAKQDVMLDALKAELEDIKNGTS